MPNAMVALANLTLGSTASTVTFGSIPATYRDLRLVMNGTVTGSGGNIVTYFNGDTTGSNYSYVQAYGDGTSVASYSGANFGSTFYSNPSVATFDFMDYSVTDKHKTNLNRSSTAGNIALMSVGRWANTAAITSIAVSHSGSSYASGTTFALYGIVSA